MKLAKKLISLQSNFLIPKASILFLKDFTYLFLETGREGERERNISVWLPVARLLLGTGPTTQAYSLLGIQPQPLGSQAGTQSTQPHQPGPEVSIQIAALSLTHVFLTSSLISIISPTFSSSSSSFCGMYSKRTLH